MNRRSILSGIATSGVAIVAQRPVPALAQPAAGKTYVLQHGAWHGGWCWVKVAEALRAQGHRVLTPTATGLGDRKHLPSASITVDTFVTDLINSIEAEELTDIILVGHSFGGIPISGAADRIPERIRHLVFLDASVLQPGQSLLGMLPPEIATARRRTIQEAGGVALPVPPTSFFAVPDDHPDAAWMRCRLTLHPAGAYDSPLMLRNPIGNGRPCTYIACTKPQLHSVIPAQQWVKAQPSWTFLELETGHNAMVLAPDTLTRMLAVIG